MTRTSIIDKNKLGGYVSDLFHKGYSLNYIAQEILSKWKININQQSVWRWLTKNGFAIGVKNTTKKILDFDIGINDFLLNRLSILTYGNCLGGIVMPYLKLTSTERSDRKNGRYHCQSLNQGCNSLVHSISYTQTTRQNLVLKTMTREYTNGYVDWNKYYNVLTIPIIVGWFWDWRLTSLLKNGDLCSLPVSLHYMEKEKLKVLNIDWNIYNPIHPEILLKTKDIRPEPHFILVCEKDLKKYGLTPYKLKKLFFTRWKNVVIIPTNYSLYNATVDNYEKYIKTDRPMESKLRLQIINYLLSSSKIPECIKRDMEYYFNLLDDNNKI